MIPVSRLNGEILYINAELILWVEKTPDTVVSFTDGQKLVVRESQEQIRELVLNFHQEKIIKEG